MPNPENRIVLSGPEKMDEILEAQWLKAESLLKEIFDTEVIWENSPNPNIPRTCCFEMRPMALEDTLDLMRMPSFQNFSEVFSSVGYFNYDAAVTLVVTSLKDQSSDERIMRFSFHRVSSMTDGVFSFQLTKDRGKIEVAISTYTAFDFSRTAKLEQRLIELNRRGDLPQTVPLIDLLELFLKRVR